MQYFCPLLIHVVGPFLNKKLRMKKKMAASQSKGAMSKKCQ